MLAPGEILWVEALLRALEAVCDAHSGEAGLCTSHRVNSMDFEIEEAGFDLAVPVCIV